MFIVRLSTCLVLVTLSQHGLGIHSQDSSALKQASNQASTNERLRPTRRHYSAQTEYENPAKKYESQMEIIHRIKSTIPRNAMTQVLIEKKLSKGWPKVGQSDHDDSRYNEDKSSKVDQNDEFFSEFTTQGKCIGECKAEETSALTRTLVTGNSSDGNDGSSYRLGALKRINYHHLSERDASKKSSSPDFVNVVVPSIEISEVSLKSEIRGLANSQKLESREHHRNRRQLRFVPVSSLSRASNSPIYRSLYPNLDISNNQSLPKLDPAFIRRILGVFDKMQPVFGTNFRSIRPGQFVLAPTRYVDDAKILPAPFGFQGNFQQHKAGKNAAKNPTGFSESRREHTTGMEMTEGSVEPIKNDVELQTSSPFDQSSSVSGDEKLTSENTHSMEREKTILEIQHKQAIPNAYKQKFNNKDLINNHESLSAKYSFEYEVDDKESSNYYRHRENRDDEITIGNYKVRLPDGRIQNVDYRVDENGYQADVTYNSDVERSKELP